MIFSFFAATIAALIAGSASPARSAFQQIGASRTVLVTVADTRGRPIVDLGPDDFVISDAGQPREILNVRPADYPIIILIDTGQGARAEFEDIRQAVLRFIGRLGQRPIAIGTIGDPPAMLTSFDDDRVLVLAKLAHLSSNASAESVALESLAMAARAAGLSAEGFSAMVVVSASAVDASRRPPEEMIGPIVDSGTIVHVVINRYQHRNADSPGRLEQTLRMLSDQTNGQFTTIYSAASYAAALDHLSERLANELLIEYLVPPGSKATDVKVGARIPGARARGLGVRPPE